MDLVRIERYVYRDVRYLKNYDGDTVDFLIRKNVDIGFGVVISGSIPIKVRLLGCDTFEIRDPDPTKREKAYKARDLVRSKLSDANKTGSIILKTERDKRGKYGRYLALVYLDEVCEDRSISRMLIDSDLTTGRFEEPIADDASQPEETS